MIRIKPIELPTIPPNGGTITSLAFQKQDPNRCSLFLDETYAFGLHIDIVMREDLKKDMHLSHDACQKLVDEDVYFKAMKRCLDYIQYRPRTRKEIQTRLTQLAVSEAISEQIVGKLDEMRLIDDSEFARMFVESRVRSKGFGATRIKQELIHKGVSAEIADIALKAGYPEGERESQLEQQIVMAERKYRKEADLRSREHKVIQFLIRRGFEAGAIRDAIRAKTS